MVNVIAELFVAGRSFAALEELDVSRDAGETNSGVYGWGLFGLMLSYSVLETASLPRLRVLRVHGNRRLFLTADGAIGFHRFLRTCPALEELHAADAATFRMEDDVPQLTPFLSLVQLHALSALCKPLRIQMLERAPLPPAVDIACGVCGALLWRRLTQFVLARKFQHQQASVVYTNVPPELEDVTFMGGDPMQLMCSNRCHATLGFFLADAGSPWINRHGFSHVIAVGPASTTADGSASPPLTTVVPLDR
jgi:hypothetical protein